MGGKIKLKKKGEDRGIPNLFWEAGKGGDELKKLEKKSRVRKTKKKNILRSQNWGMRFFGKPPAVRKKKKNHKTACPGAKVERDV